MSNEKVVNQIFTAKVDADGIYRIRYWVDEQFVEVISAGELPHRLEHALTYWNLCDDLQRTVRTWLDAQRPQKKSKSFGRSREYSRRQ